ncbi:MAG: peroxiredoxin [Candidatus Kapabacteria bacterium]|nr:peroxiredoxin [Candidatus Kapabacteria bacterium]
MEIGDIIPAFSATADDGSTISSESLRNKLNVIYFYPKDNTSGCTQEACDFRDNMVRISGLGVNLIGVSPDSVKSHSGFIQKYGLNFKLIADVNKDLCNLFSVMGEKSLYGRKYMGVIRSTFLINSELEVLYKWTKVKVSGHVDEIISKIQEINKND